MKKWKWLGSVLIATAISIYQIPCFAAMYPQLNEIGAGTALPAVGSDSAISYFQLKNWNTQLSSINTPYNQSNNGIYSGNFAHTGTNDVQSFGVATATGYNQFSLGYGHQVASKSFRYSINLNGQFAHGEPNNLKLSGQWDWGNTVIGARTVLATVSPNGVQDLSFGIASLGTVFQPILDLQTDGTFGNYRFWPGFNLMFGSFEYSLSGSVLLASYGRYYAESFKTGLAYAFRGNNFIRLMFQSTNTALLGAGFEF